jgi:hypothetical protein
VEAKGGGRDGGAVGRGKDGRRGGGAVGGGRDKKQKEGLPVEAMADILTEAMTKVAAVKTRWQQKQNDGGDGRDYDGPFGGGNGGVKGDGLFVVGGDNG